MNSKEGKSIGHEIDISNGSLFLMIKELERDIKALKFDIKKLQEQLHQVDIRDAPIGER